MLLDKLREKMAENNIDFYIIPTLDPHSSEYLPDHYKERAFVTGFTGSAGTAVVSKDSALLWADGRYFIQAKRQIENTGFELMKMGIDGVPTYIEWIKDKVGKGQTIALNYKYYLQGAFEDLESTLADKEVKIIDADLIKDLWTNRPELPLDKIFVHDIKFAGKTSEEKLSEVRERFKRDNTDVNVITSLADIAWLFNIRSFDIEDTPVAISYAIVEADNAYLFVNREKLTDEVIKHLEKVCEIKDYDEIFDFIKKYENKNIYLDKNSINHKLFSEINSNNNIINGKNYTEYIKGIKNEVELENIRKCSIRDGVAVTKFIYWVKNIVKEKEISEIDAANKLREIREMGEYFVEDSFGTISAYKANAAMAHYTATEDNYAMIKNKGFLLVDSGAQYYDGTTDITRTIVVGPLEDIEIRDFTLVLKSHLALMGVKFLKGTTDRDLDIVARYPLWREYENFNHGTGHGVGFFLGVHEGPHSISPRSKGLPLEIGMIVSNEPGIYKEGSHGIRTENIVEVVEDKKNEYGQFYRLNTMSLAPIDIDAIDVNMLDDYEINLLNEYHKRVFNTLGQYLEENEKVWLSEVTKEIQK